MRVISPPSNPRMMCHNRIDRGECGAESARLQQLEAQMVAYLKAFKLPGDYRERMLAYCQGMEVVTGAEAEVDATKARLNRIKELYSWGDMGKAEYLAERHELQARLATLAVSNTRVSHLDRIGQFLQNFGLAWEGGDQEQRNRLAAELFEAVWVDKGQVLAVTPHLDMIPFFDLVYSEVAKHSVHMAVGSPSGPLVVTFPAATSNGL